MKLRINFALPIALLGTLAAWVYLHDPLKPAPVVYVSQALCPVTTGACRVILTWVRPTKYTATTDTAHVTWVQTQPSANTFAAHTPLGTADTLAVNRPDTVTKFRSGTAKLCYSRTGWGTTACNGLVAWRVDLPVEPLDTATALKVTSLNVKPDSFKVMATETGKPVGPANTQQMCAFPGFASGHVAFRRVTEGSISFCDSTYRAAFTAAARAVTPEEQAMADAVCVTWTATGGSITGEACGPNPAVRWAPNVQSNEVKVVVEPAWVPPVPAKVSLR